VEESWFEWASLDTADIYLEVYNADTGYNTDTLDLGTIGAELTDEDTPEWAILTYFAADNNLEPYFISYLDDMEEAVSNDEVAIVAQLDRTPGWWATDAQGNPVWMDDSSHGDWTTTRRFVVAPDGSSSSFATSGIDLGEVNMGSRAALTDFINWGMDALPVANHYALVLGDHGLGWPAICSDDTDSDFLSIADVESSIHDAGVTFDTVFLNACLMGGMEVASYMEDVCDYLVVSEANMWGIIDTWTTFDVDYYRDVVAGISSSTSPAALASSVAEQYYQSCTAWMQDFDMTISAITTSTVDMLLDRIDAFASSMIDHIEDAATYRSASIAALRFNGEPMYVDLYDFAYRVWTSAAESSVVTAAANVLSMFNASAGMIIANETNEAYEDARGLSAYLPDYHFDTFWEEYLQTDYAGEHLWDDFIGYLWNEEPQASDDVASVAENSPGSVIDVVANDEETDPGQELTISEVTDPGHGTAWLEGGQVFYRPDPHYFGLDSFMYTVTDGYGGTDSASVEVTVNRVDDNLALSVSPGAISEGDGPGAATGTVTRDGPTDVAVLVNLSSDDTSEARVPTSVTIPAGHASATFAVDAVDDSVLDGTQTVTITASASGYVSANDTVDVLDDEQPSLAVAINPSMFSEGAGVGAATGTVARTGSTASALVVSLSSSDTGEATVPTTVTIQAGHTSATFQVNAVDDLILDGTQTVTITASAAGYDSDNETVNVTDNEMPSLSLAVLPSTFSEADGTNAATGTVTRTGSTSSALVVDLSSDDTSEATVPATVTIPSGQTSATFQVSATDDSILDGTQNVTLTASATGYEPGTAVMDVTDDEVPDTIPPTVLGVALNGGVPQRSMVKEIAVQLSEDCSTSIDPACLSLRNVTTGTDIAAADMAVSYDAATNTATWTFPGLPGGTLPDGNYTAKLLGSAVADLAGNPLDGNDDGTGGDDYAFDLFRFFGDADGDRDVDFADLFKFRGTYQKDLSDPAFNPTFDADSDGDVDFADLFKFRGNYQDTLEVPFDLVVSEDTLTVPEGGTAQFTVALSDQPHGTVTVTTTRTSGDEDLSVASGGTLTFDSTDWNVSQTVTLGATEDADIVDGRASFSVYADGAVNQPVVTATENDNDRQQTGISIVWEADVTHSDTVSNEITRVKLTPDGEHLIVFHYNGSSYGIPGRIEKIGTATGDIVWEKTVTKTGERISLTGWVDGAGNLFFGPSWSGYTLWKYDSELATELWSYTGNSNGFEYVCNVITDDVNNVYAAGYNGSSSNRGSRIVKLTEGGGLVWESLSHYSSGKDDYTYQIALDSVGNAFRVGADKHYDGSPWQGRLLGHNAADGTEFLNVAVSDSDSAVWGVAVGSADSIIIGYSYNLGHATGQPVEQERTVVQKLDQAGNILWEHRFDEIGMYLSPNAITRYNDSMFLMAYHQRVDDTIQPGIAAFTDSGQFLWKETLDQAGWVFDTAGLDVWDGAVYTGLTYAADRTQAKALRLSIPVPRVIGSVELPQSPRWNSIGVNPTGDTLFVPTYVDGDTTSGTVYALDSSTLQVTGTMPTGYDPIDVAISPDGMVGYVTNTVNGYKATKFDAVNMTVIGDVSTGTDSGGVIFTPDGATVYTTNHWSSYLSIIDVATNTNVGSVSGIGSGGYDLAITPDGQFIYALGLTGNIYKVSTSSNTVVHTITRDFAGSGGQRIAMLPSGEQFLVSGGGTNSVHVFDTSSDSEVSVVGVGGRTAGVAVTGDGQLVAVALPESDQVKILDAVSLGEMATIDIAGYPIGVAFSPDNQKLYVTSRDNSTLTVIDLYAAELPPVTEILQTAVNSTNGQVYHLLAPKPASSEQFF